MNLENSEKIQLTHAMKEAFPTVKTERKSTDGKRKTVYRGLKKKIPFSLPENDLSTHETVASLEWDINSEIAKLKNAIRSKEIELSTVKGLINQQLDSEEFDKENVKVLFQKSMILDSQIKEYHDVIEKKYETELVKLCASPKDQLQGREKVQLEKEVEELTKIVNKGLFMSSKVLSSAELSSLLSSLLQDLQSQCPLIYHIVESLLLTKADGSVQKGSLRALDASHALALLVGLRSQKLENNFKQLFTFLCISYGAGNRFIGMLHHIGLTMAWTTAMKLLDERLKKLQKARQSELSDLMPVILLMDNINMYRGKQKHLRLFRYMGPKMWNFTGRATLLPYLNEHLTAQLNEPDKTTKSQRNPLTVTFDDLLLESEPEKALIWRKTVDQYLLSLLDDCLNRIKPSMTKSFKEITEKDCVQWLSKATLSDEKQKRFVLKVPPRVVTDRNKGRKSNVHVLPLSLEDNSTIAGSMNILQQFANEFNLPDYENIPEQIPFDNLQKKFDIKKARAHFELLVSQHNHQDHMGDLEERLRSLERKLDTVVTEEEINEADLLQGMSEEEIPVISCDKTTLEAEHRLFRLQDKPFWDMFNSLYGELCGVIDSKIQEKYYRFVLDLKRSEKFALHDHLKRTLLHVAVEQSNLSYIKFLIDVGIDVNSKEGCGLTPLSLAVLKNDPEVCEFLVDCGACYDGPLFASIPSPKDMATILQLAPVLEVFQLDLNERDKEDGLISLLDSRFIGNEESKKVMSSDGDIQEASENERPGTNRSCKGFLTPVAGDVDTCKTNEAVMSRSSAFRWIGTCPGDLQNKGYFCEATFKTHGSSGMHYILMHVMKRKQLTSEVFRDKKFNDYNLEIVREGVRDGCRSYGLAAVFEFVESDDFPSPQQLAQSKLYTSEHGPLLLDSFKQWIDKCSNIDLAFKHRASAFLFYGPLLRLYDESTSFGNGYVRELIYQLQIPVYKQLQFRNYFNECFRHVFNMMFKWPLTVRQMMWDNCYVNLSGGSGKGIELDAFVESEVVKPIKQYASGHSTVTVCERIMGNLYLFKAVRKGYTARECFDIHHTSRHSVPSAIHDQVKGC